MLIVCDRANARLQTFSLDGKPIAATESGKTVLFPAHAKTRGDVLLVPDLHARVSLFDKENKPIVHLGDDPGLAEESARRLQGPRATEGVAGRQVRPPARRLPSTRTATSSSSSGCPPAA